ncbi:hypothetical protein D623_10010951 [Myotis brandtii]|uniref:Uncharacterized protein n=1 Tax=Myotis brandtii TaxID=109478 RepID=S7QE54_MYOBR|nr:hypothetical protein D623_10010951 [Myotis brandtii]
MAGEKVEEVGKDFFPLTPFSSVPGKLIAAHPEQKNEQKHQTNLARQAAEEVKEPPCPAGAREDQSGSEEVCED